MSNTRASQWIRERVRDEIDRMFTDFKDRGLTWDSEEAKEEVLELVLRKKWKRV